MRAGTELYARQNLQLYTVVLSSSKIVHIKAILVGTSANEPQRLHQCSPYPDPDLAIFAPCLVSKMIKLFVGLCRLALIDLECSRVTLVSVMGWAFDRLLLVLGAAFTIHHREVHVGQE